MPSSHLILCCPLLLLPPIPPSIRVFSNESTLRLRGPKYWSFSFSISPSSEQPGLISCRMDWLDFLAVQGTLKSLLQHHSSKASIFQRSVFFIVQLSHPYMTTGKTIALARQTFVGKVMSHRFMANRWKTSGTSGRLYFWGSKITADGDCSHETKRHLLLERKAMTNLDNILKIRDITLPTKVCLAKAMVGL